MSLFDIPKTAWLPSAFRLYERTGSILGDRGGWILVAKSTGEKRIWMEVTFTYLLNVTFRYHSL